ncbi:MAG: histidine--tRNA ligase [Candidatus Bathyarchaeia archaeon]
MSLKSFLKPYRGMRDYLPKDLYERRVVEEAIRELFKLYCYEEVETPTVEYYELLAAKVGEETRRTMYVFKDLAGRTLALRPEGTAPIVRLVTSKLKTSPKPLRLGYIWDFYRYDEPQRGRYRRFYQGGFELLGSSKPEADIEILSISIELMKKLKLEKFQVKLSDVGVLRGLMSNWGVDENVQNRVLSLADKKNYGEAIKELEVINLDEASISKVAEIFKLKGLNYKSIICEAKSIVGSCEHSIRSLENLEVILDNIREIYPEPEYILDLGFARGLEYYTGMIFEVFVENLDIALIGGGRYDKLVELYGGDPTPATGCAAGIDRLALAMKINNVTPPPPPNRRIYLYILDGVALSYGFKVSTELRANGIPVEIEVMDRSLSKGLSTANKKNYPYTLILGSKEAKAGLVTLKNMSTGFQETLTLREALNRIKSDFNTG